jgi:protein-disulfide isomerase
MTKEMSKRQQRREKMRRAEQRSRLITIGLISLGAILIALVFIYPNFKPIGEITMPETNARPNAQANFAGDPNAPVKITEYSDFQCPFCARFWRDTEKQIMDTYVATGKVYFEYRSAGEFIGGPGGESARAAEAAYCAGDQNKFWEMHDIIFANQTGENVGNFTDARLIAFADKVGLDTATFKDCFNGNKYVDKVKQDGGDAQKDITSAPNFAELVAAGKYSQSGISTPSFLVNGRLLPGALSFSEFQTEIENALAGN